MPQRSNDFQDLVALIQRALAPKGARVSESAMVPDGQNELREIDVLIENPSGPYIVKIAVEAKGESRKMDKVRFDAIIGKYSAVSGIRADKVFVVHKAGFTKGVWARAKKEGIALYTLQEAIVANWALNLGNIVVFFPPRIQLIELFPKLSTAELRTWLRATAVDELSGLTYPSVVSDANRMLRDPDFVEGLMAHSSRANLTVRVCRVIHFPTGCVFRIPGAERRFEKAAIHVECTYSRGAVSVEAFKLGEQTVHHITADVAGSKLEYATAGIGVTEQGSLKIVGKDIPTTTDGQDFRFIPESKAPTELSAMERQLHEMLKNTFSGLDVTVVFRSIIHDYATGQDHSVTALVHAYINAEFRLLTAIVLSEECGGAREKLWGKIIANTHLDRLLVISPLTHLSTDSKYTQSSRLIYVGWDTFEKDLVQYVIPSPVVSVDSIIQQNMEFHGPESFGTRSKFIKPVLDFGGRPLAMRTFCDGVCDVVKSESMAAVLQNIAFGEAFLEVPTTFQARLPRDCFLVDQDSRRELQIITGTARTRIFLSLLCDPIIMEEAGVKCIRLNSEAKTYSVFGASLPRRPPKQTANHPMIEPIRLPETLIAERLFTRAFFARDELDLASSESVTHKVASFVSIAPGEWRLKLHHQRDARRSLIS